MDKIFLGGTCNGSTWREEIIPELKKDFFNPVVEDWTPECQQIEEIEKRDKCNIHLYVITAKMTGVFSIAEAIESTMTEGIMTFLQICPASFDEFQLRSLKAVGQMVEKHGGIVFVSDSFDALIEAVNNA